MCVCVCVSVCLCLCVCVSVCMRYAISTILIKADIHNQCWIFKITARFLFLNHIRSAFQITTSPTKKCIASPTILHNFESLRKKCESGLPPGRGGSPLIPSLPLTPLNTNKQCTTIGWANATPHTTALLPAWPTLRYGVS